MPETRRQNRHIDYNLNKVATIRGVAVININDLANALKPVLLPGESLTVKMLKPGDQPGQGVGYLEDGTMVVVDEAPDEETVARLALAIRAGGAIRTETLRAFTEDEYRKIIAALP